jgi:hypothetical protein
MANQKGGDLYPFDTTMMRPARKVMCDSPVPDFFITYLIYSKNVHFMKKCLKIKR